MGAAAVTGVRLTRHQTTLLEPVDAVGGAPRRDHHLELKGFRTQGKGVTLTAQRREQVEGNGVKTETCEILVEFVFDVAREPRKSANRTHRPDVEFGTDTPPLF